MSEFKIGYRNWNPQAGAQDMIIQAQEIIEEYEEAGFMLTLRQLYYQFVSRDLLKNEDAEYHRLGNVINRARLAGMISWLSLEDRTRFLRAVQHWTDPLDSLRQVTKMYAINKWRDQPYKPEVWIEKDALLGVIEGVCNSLDVPYFSCRGYASQSEVWRAGQRFERYRDRGQIPIIFYLGDHDPSGKDMTWDIWKRLALFAGYSWKGIKDYYASNEAFQIKEFNAKDNARKAPIVRRLALNFDQIQKYNPPPNPAKFTDSRVKSYVNLFGESSWELDALDPAVMSDIVRDAILDIRDHDIWDKQVKEEDEGRSRLGDFVTQLENELGK